MRNFFLILFLLIGCFSGAQSFRTITLTGNATDFTDKESYNAPENNSITYGVAYDETNIYFSVVNRSGTFGQSDSFNIFIDTDPDGDASGSNTGTNFSNVTPTLPFNADFSIRVEENYNERRAWTGTDWSALTQNFSAQEGNNHRQFAISKAVLGNPEMIRFTMWMGYNGGTFAEVPADRSPNNDNNPVFTEYFGAVDMNRAGSNPSKVVNTNATYASFTGGTIPAGTYSRLEVDGFPSVAGDITIAPGGTLALTGTTILNLGANNLTFDNWAGMAVDVGPPATLNGTGLVSFGNGGISRTNDNTGTVSLTINPDISVNGDFYAINPIVGNSISFNANALNRMPLRYSQGSVLTYRSNLMTSTGPEWGTGSIVALSGVPDNVIVDQPSLEFDSDKNLFGYLQIDSGNLDLNGFDFILKSDTSRSAVIGPIASGASVTGNTVVARRFIPKRTDNSPAFRFLASPVNGQTIFESIQANGGTPIAVGTQVTGGSAALGFDQNSTGNPSMFTFNNVSQSWESIANTNATNFEVGVPFRTFIRGDRTVSLTTTNNEPATNTTLVAIGSIVQGDVTYDAASTVNPLSDAANEFNMIANPYPSYTDMSTVLGQSTDVNPNFYFMWDPSVNTRGSYVTVSLSTTNATLNGTNNVMGSNADQFLEPWQACFIVNDAAATDVSVLFSEDSKTVETTATQVFNTPATLNRLAFTLYNDQDMVLDGTLVDYNATFSNAIDEMDALKINNLDENLGVQVAGNAYSILRNAMPLDGEILDLSIGNYRTSNYKISIQLDGLAAYDITLVDTYLNVQHDMSTSDYTFTVDASIAASIAPDRFHVIFNNATLSGDDAALPAGEAGFAKAISIYPNPVTNGIIHIKNTTALSGTATVYTMLGQQVASQSFNTSRSMDVTHLDTGTYVLKIKVGNDIATHKMTIK